MSSRTAASRSALDTRAGKACVANVRSFCRGLVIASKIRYQRGRTATEKRRMNMDLLLTSLFKQHDLPFVLLPESLFDRVMGKEFPEVVRNVAEDECTMAAIRACASGVSDDIFGFSFFVRVPTSPTSSYKYRIFVNLISRVLYVLADERMGGNVATAVSMYYGAILYGVLQWPAQPVRFHVLCASKRVLHPVPQDIHPLLLGALGGDDYSKAFKSIKDDKLSTAVAKAMALGWREGIRHNENKAKAEAASRLEMSDEVVLLDVQDPEKKV